ncbi:MAG: hypothetical protein ACRDVW_09175 [Acidimicrobiales bacterium]
MSWAPRLHVPSEPDREVWRRRVMQSATIDEVIEKEDGIAAWLWERWRVLESAGLDRTRFVGIVTGYRREIWLWLIGERTWGQCCSGLIGRIDRRLGAN